MPLTVDARDMYNKITKNMDDDDYDDSKEESSLEFEDQTDDDEFEPADALVQRLLTPDMLVKNQTKFKFGLGDTCISWPPPEHLEAENVVKQYGSVKEVRKLNNDEHAVPKVERGKHEFYVIHNFVGGNVDSGSMQRRIVILASTEGTNVLKMFCDEILAWHEEKNNFGIVDKGFQLRRFRVEHGQGFWQTEGHQKSASNKFSRFSWKSDG